MEDNFLAEFFARYLCGAGSLKHLRTVSRKRLELARTGVFGGDIEAENLANLISKYNKSSEYLSKLRAITTIELCNAHEILLAGDELATPGKVREVNSWIGHESKPSYVPPSPKQLKNQLQNWNNSGDIKSRHDLISQFCKLLLIHPFRDGNGRLARAYFQSQMRKVFPHTCNIELYRLVSDHTAYKTAIQRQHKSFHDNTIHSYWEKSLEWCSNLAVSAENIYKSYYKETQKRLLLCSIDVEKQRFIKGLWSNPITTVEKMSSTIGVDENRAIEILDFCIHLGLLKEFSIFKQRRIWVAESVFDYWKLIDEKITKNTNNKEGK